MITTCRSTVGKKVIELETGTALGEVRGLLLDPGRDVVEAVILGNGRPIRLEAIRSFGKDSIMVDLKQPSDPRHEEALMERFRAIGSVTNKPVITTQGEEIGVVEDWIFDGFTGELQVMILSGGGVRKFLEGGASLPANYVDTIGPDSVIVKSGATDALMKRDGGLDRIVRTFQKKFRPARKPSPPDAGPPAD